MTIKPSQDYLLVEVEGQKNETESGIFTGAHVVKEPQLATVIASGPDASEYEVGTIVFIGSNRGVELMLKDKNYMMMKKSHVYARVSK